MIANVAEQTYEFNSLILQRPAINNGILLRDGLQNHVIVEAINTLEQIGKLLLPLAAARPPTNARSMDHERLRSFAVAPPVLVFLEGCNPLAKGRWHRT